MSSNRTVRAISPPASPGPILRRNVSANVSASVGLMLFVCLLFCQFGYHVMASFSVLGLIILVYFSSWKMLTWRAILFAYIMSFGWFVFYLTNQAPLGNVLRDFRVLLMGVLFFVVVDGRPLRIPLLERHLLTAIFAAAGLAIIQDVMRRLGVSYAVPAHFFAIDSDPSLAAEGVKLAALGGYEFQFRASGLYSEPSYLGWICVSLLYVAMNLPRGWRRLVAVSVCLLGVVVSQSVLGLVAAAGLMLLMARRQVVRSYIPYVLTVLALGAVAVMVGGVGDRLSGVLRLSDASATVRLLEPFAAISDVFVEVPFGIPPGTPLSVGLNDMEFVENVPMHNAFLNLFIYFGTLGFVVAFLMFSVMKTHAERWLLFVALTQNGGFFSPDKVFVLVFVILVARGLRQSICRQSANYAMSK